MCDPSSDLQVRHHRSPFLLPKCGTASPEYGTTAHRIIWHNLSGFMLGLAPRHSISCHALGLAFGVLQASALHMTYCVDLACSITPLICRSEYLSFCRSKWQESADPVCIIGCRQRCMCLLPNVDHRGCSLKAGRGGNSQRVQDERAAMMRQAIFYCTAGYWQGIILTKVYQIS